MLAVTGATGFLGEALLDRAARGAVAVRALARRPQPDRPGVSWFTGDLSSGKALTRLAQGAEAMIHCAALTHASDPAQFALANVTGTLNAIEAAVAAGVPRFILVSSLSAREPSLSAYGASKARAERLVMASGLDWTIVRPPGIYGPRDRDFLELFKSARLGVVPVPRAGRASLIHADDLAALLLALVPGGEAVTSHSFEPDDGKPQGWSHGELARAIGWAVGRRPAVLPLSPAMMRAAARADRALRGNRARLTLDRVGYMSHPDWVVDPARCPPAALWHARIATRAGLKATAEWYRENRWL